MSVIRKLAPEVASRIAAGEVVERPFNVVKELMENSVDAGASKITVEIADGGLSLIRITDDGKGIGPEDLPLALERFATSKASSVEDVYCAGTFGFRGEALAAVSSVSDFTLRSGTASGKTFEIKSRFGETGEVKPAPAVKGTVAEAVNLFENVPARRKFLKGSRSLESEIIKFVKHFSLINPGVEVAVYSNGKCAYEAFLQEDTCIRASKVFPGKGFCRGELKYGSSAITVAATLPAACDRLKRDCIILGVNGRLIKDPSLVQAVVRSYHRLIPDGRFPAAAVDIRIKPDEVDANVHPAKLEVRFEKPRDIFCMVTDAVAKSFEGRGMTAEYGPAGEKDEGGSKCCIMKESSSGGVSVPFLTAISAEVKTKKPEYVFNLTELEIPDEESVSAMLPPYSAGEAFNAPESVSARPSSAFSGIEAPSIASHEPEPLREKRPLPSFRIAGQVGNTYIICETDSGSILFIDQHAAHERILFEKAQRRERAEKASIVLHDPVKVTLTPEQAEGVFENSDIIESYGYSFREAGKNVFEITRVPHIAVRKNIASAFEKIVSELYVTGRSKTEDAPRALLSCKAAIKAGDRLTEMEMEYLVKLLFNTDNYGTCPHGRPIIYTMSLTELSRKFLR